MYSFQNILVYVDTEHENYTALHRAAFLAIATGAAVKVVDLVPNQPWLHPRMDPPPWVLPSAIAEQKRKRLEEHAEPLRSEGAQIEVEILYGNPSVEIIREALRSGCDLVTMGPTHGEDKKAIDSTAMHLLRNCPCPVALARPRKSGEHLRILACVDPAPQEPERQAINGKVMEVAKSVPRWRDSLTRWRNVELHVIHAWKPFGESYLRGGSAGLSHDELHRYVAQQRTQIKRGFKDFLSSFDGEIPQNHTHLLRGDPEVVIPRFARKAQMDVAVMGTLARSGISGFFIGNTAEKIVAKLDCSLVAVKPDGFESPVKVEDLEAAVR